MTLEKLLAASVGLLRALPLYVCILLAGPATAANYYVDSLLGNDSNAGTTTAAPWKTLRKVSQSTFASGSVVYLKRGSKWAEDLWIPSSGMTIDAYGDSALPLPTLDSSVPVTAWTAVPGAPGLYYAFVNLPATNGPDSDVGPGLGNIGNNGALLYPVPWNIDPACGGGASDPLFHLKKTQVTAGCPEPVAPNNSYVHDTQPVSEEPFVGPDVTIPRMIVIKTSVDPNSAGQNYTASTLLYGVIARNKTDIVLKNLKMTRFSLHAVEFSDCVRCEARNLVMNDGGGAWVLNARPPKFSITLAIYAGNGVQWSNNSSAGLADGLVISNLLDSGISPQTFDTNKHLSDITIRNSTIDKVGFGGVEISSLYFQGGGYDSTISGITISNLEITNAGRGWSGNRYGSNAEGIRVDADMIPAGDYAQFGLPPNAAHNQVCGVTIENTRIINSIGNGIRLDGNVGTVTVNRSRLSANSYGLRAFGNQVSHTMKLVLKASIVDANTEAGVYFEEGPDIAGQLPSVSAGFDLFHNTFYNNGIKNLWVRAPQSGQARVENNILAGTYDLAQLFVDSSSGPNSLSSATLNYNCYSKSPNMIFYGSYTPYPSIVPFNMATGAESAGVEAVAAPPSNPTGLGLANPFAGDFSLIAASVCIGTGRTGTGVTHDYLGQAYKTPPSAGAVERP